MLALFRVLLSLLCAYCLCAEEDKTWKPRLVLHIGPHKTGTTSLQFAFEAEEKIIEAAGWRILDFVPFARPGSVRTDFGGISPLRPIRSAVLSVGQMAVLDMRNPGKSRTGPPPSDAIEALAKAFTAAATAAEEGHFNYAMVHEAFDTYDDERAKLLAEMTKRFDVTIVGTYREFNSITVSAYNAHSDFSSSYRMRYRDYPDFSAAKVLKPLAYDFYDLISTFKKHFADVRVMDYYGIQAAGTDIQHVYFCDVMGVKELCPKEHVFENTNSGSSKTHLNLLVDLENFFFSQVESRCDMRHLRNEEAHDAFLDEGERLVEVEPVPTKKSYATSDAMRLSETIDKNVRTDAFTVLYGNETASKVHAKEGTYNLDVDAVIKSETWRTFLQDRLAIHIAKGHCTGGALFQD